MTSIPFTEGFQPAQAIWPPILKKCKTINYVNAPLTPRYSRDIGRSFELGARTYYVFGDTFCNDAGLVSNTYQLVKDLKQPTDAIYLSSDKSGLVDPLIPLTEEEKKLEDEKNARIALWCFGGVVEVTCGIGYMWYQKHRFDNKSDAGVLEGVGVARISADELSGKLTANRFDGLMFNPAEPLMGSFSAMAEDGWAYVWGQMAEKIYLGRAPVPQCHIRESYWYWNGSEYVKDLKQAVPVMQDMQQGQIFRSDLFGNMFPWVFVGVTRWADNNVMIGVSSTIEGPWDIKPVAKTEGIVKDDAYKYCVYPHLWGSNESKGKLLVTWCDAWPGGVIAANLKLQITDSFHWVEIPLDGYSYPAVHSAVQDAERISRQSLVKFVERVVKGQGGLKSSVHSPGFEHRSLVLRSECNTSLRRAVSEIVRTITVVDRHSKVKPKHDPEVNRSLKTISKLCCFPFFCKRRT